jgi:hypothetical protein
MHATGTWQTQHCSLASWRARGLVLASALNLTFAVQLRLRNACHGPSHAQAAILGAHLAEAVHNMWPQPKPCIVPARSNMQGFTALHAAALASRDAMAVMLVDAATHASAAQLAKREQASLEESMLVQLLRARDAHGRTPLHVAAGAANAAVRCIHCSRLTHVFSVPSF